MCALQVYIRPDVEETMEYVNGVWRLPVADILRSKADFWDVVPADQLIEG